MSISQRHGGSMSSNSGRGSGRYSPAIVDQNLGEAEFAPPRDNSLDRSSRRGASAEDNDDNMRPHMKRIDQQYLCRGLVCLNATGVAVAGAFAFVIGIYSLAAGPSSWLPSSFGAAHTDVLTIGGTCTGGVIMLLSLGGVLGACLRKKPFLFLFGLVVGAAGASSRCPRPQPPTALIMHMHRLARPPLPTHVPRRCSSSWRSPRAARVSCARASGSSASGRTRSTVSLALIARP